MNKCKSNFGKIKCVLEVDAFSEVMSNRLRHYLIKKDILERSFNANLAQKVADNIVRNKNSYYNK